MREFVNVEFGALEVPVDGDLVVFVGDDLQLSQTTTDLLGGAASLIAAAAKAGKFKGKSSSFLDLLAPTGLPVGRLIVAGLGGAKDRKDMNWVNLGGAVMARIGGGAKALIALDLPPVAETETDHGQIGADLLLGLKLRAYKFDRYKTKKKDEDKDAASGVTIGIKGAGVAKKAARRAQALAEGVVIARDLVNEPPNVLYPIEFARRAEKLKELGVEVDILDRKDLEKLGMRALLAVGQGSAHESRVAIMHWKGTKKDKSKPIAFIGKGVCFDSGGISIKPGGGMEDMKGDMAGAACVVGLMHALASRKAKANVIGAIGLVENMPDGAAQRPGDIVTSMSGQTIEIINTDAEGRLVLADVLWHIQNRIQARFHGHLATLTGAILVALGQAACRAFLQHDELAERPVCGGQGDRREGLAECRWALPTTRSSIPNSPT